jgi:uncharacterized protein YrrD
MLFLSKSFEQKPIASVQSSHRIGVLGNSIIDPRNLKIVAFFANSRALGENLVLHTSDIREFSPAGAIIDNNDQLMTLDDDLVRLKKVVEYDFSLIDKPVYSEDKRRLGKVTDYAIDNESFFVVKLYVSRPVVKSLGVSQLIIDRTQIVSVTDAKVIVRSGRIKQPATTKVRQTLFGKSAALEPEQSQVE